MYWKEKAEKLRESTNSSFWLRNALSALNREDVDEALEDATIVLDLIKLKKKAAETEASESPLMQRRKMRRLGTKIKKIK